MRRLALALVVLCAACSLPLPHGVHPVGEVPAAQGQTKPFVVIPPGPHAGASPAETVLGFLGAQASSDNRHAVAREYLAAGVSSRWDDTAGVEVYDPAKLAVRALPGSTARNAQVEVSSVVLGRIGPEGSYAAEAPTTVREDYGLQREQGQWRLTDVPTGLRLTPADRERAFQGAAVYYLVPSSGNPHVVPDVVEVPTGSDEATSLVRRLLLGPSPSLAGSVVSAVPPGSRLRRDVQLSGSGIATVDLTGSSPLPTGSAAQRFSAQVVWTLRSLGPGFKGLRLLADGHPLPVPGQGQVQDPGAWDAYDPEGIGRSVPYYYVLDRRLHSSADLPSSPLTTGALPLDEAAVSPDRRLVAVLSHANGQDVVRTGTLQGPTYPVVLSATGLRSLSWGSGLDGLWLLRGQRTILLVTDKGVRQVSAPTLPAGTVTSLAASRDGVRLVLAVGGRLYVGRLQVGARQVTLNDVVEVLPALHHVVAAAWGSSSEIVVLGALTHVGQVVRVVLDGSRATALDTSGLIPSDVGASAAGVVLVASGRLYVSTGAAFRRVGSGRATHPVFPG